MVKLKPNRYRQGWVTVDVDSKPHILKTSFDERNRETCLACTAKECRGSCEKIKRRTKK